MDNDKTCLAGVELPDGGPCPVCGAGKDGRCLVVEKSADMKKTNAIAAPSLNHRYLNEPTFRALVLSLVAAFRAGMTMGDLGQAISAAKNCPPPKESGL